METALSASPRIDCISKSENILKALPLVKATIIDAPMIKGAYLYLECKLHKIIDDFDDYSLITGTIVAAQVNKHHLRVSDKDERMQLKKYPLLAYIAQGRFARVEDTLNFPFPKDFKK
jgi:flavin reductase (DIM6/NTAB) family NADH-FMN oxidoreductase RutF